MEVTHGTSASLGNPGTELMKDIVEDLSAPFLIFVISVVRRKQRHGWKRDTQKFSKELSALCSKRLRRLDTFTYAMNRIYILYVAQQNIICKTIYTVLR